MCAGSVLRGVQALGERWAYRRGGGSKDTLVNKIKGPVVRGVVRAEIRESVEVQSTRGCLVQA